MFRQTVGVVSLVALVTSHAIAVADLPSNSDSLRVTVVFASGRSARAVIDPRTNVDRLWLRFGTEKARLTRAVAWHEVSLFKSDGERLSRDEAIQIANSAAAVRSPDPSAKQMIHDVETKTPLQPRTRTSFVRFDAAIANWDDDVEVDGLLIQVMPFSSSGEPMRVRGQMNVELWSMRRIEQDSAPHLRGRSLEVLQRWSVPLAVDPADSIDWTKLPFQARHPEFDFNWSSIGLVHIELVVPGHGVFHHSIDSIRIRPYAPLRDAIQVQTNERFFPTELNGRK